MGVKITGIDKLQKQLKEVEKATEALNGSYDVRFDANDPVSIENAIQEAYCLVDKRASDYATNPMVSPLIEHMKESLRQQILDSAEQQREESGQDGD
ncbi:TPA: hypothetical protein NHV36_004523 [Klebsiella michiganensis]|uniref:hypothetical protein n=1 Tax=Klebsiella michiganensis TaxID=1134687 RepID=UPI000D526CDC|nr:hypothetical protein [Klebsiella michiganensis]MDU7903445.1 hypothetical protein [Enterobacter hormaechei]QLX18542.1 hypothetical protein HV230_28715 [Klebsiella oxytoca]AWF49964.1 hypothetical protein CSC12_6452 [Klebsiella michiganensis]MDU7884318.1 hypothetical protein [Klebsiella michiganensis]HCE8859301.1 hypothetical protein [Klebsiella michiganensis]